MNEYAGFCVLYRFKIRPGKEETFRDGWSRMTRAIRENRGGLGSRLHLADDGVWVAYAQWPDRNAWERSREMETADPAAARLMAESIEQSEEPMLLTPTNDLLVLCRAKTE
jgi:quinol monooxygenase YgiN